MYDIRKNLYIDKRGIHMLETLIEQQIIKFIFEVIHKFCLSLYDPCENRF